MVDGRLVLSPTDLTKHLACVHITSLDVAAARTGSAQGATGPDDALQLVFRKGLEHEAAYLQRLKDSGLDVREIPTRFDEPGRRESERETVVAMRAGVDVVYQATFYDGQWGGQADFLLRRERPSALGPWSYDIADTKLARRLKVPALLQMAMYAARLGELQGVAPQTLTVVAGDDAEHSWRLEDVAAYARRVRGRFADAVEAVDSAYGMRLPMLTEAAPTWQCSQCRWEQRCAAQWVGADDLSLVAGMRRGHREVLREQGVLTLAQLAGTMPDRVTGLGRTSRERLTQQARLQLKERLTGEPVYELLDPVPSKGLLALPEPADGDLYLDFEGDAFAGPHGREYLAGLWDRRGSFSSWWAHSHDQEKVLVEHLVDELMRRWAANPDLHVYHYASYEVSALKRLTGRHGTREAELDTMLRAELFVDLYAVVRAGLRISKPSYSIKKLEDFYWGGARTATDGGVADAMTSIVEYERWLLEGDQSILDKIESYNRDDVRSTHDLHTWLEGRRDELGARHGWLPRPMPGADDRSAAGQGAEQDELDLAQQLLDAHDPLLAGLVGWHRRESRPAWWDFFRVEDLDEEELVEDSATVGGLSEPQHVGNIAKSRIWRYTFPPQDCRLSVGQPAFDVDSHVSVGAVVGLDAAGGWLELKLGASRAPAQPRGLGPPGPIMTKVLQDAIRDVAVSSLRGEPGLGRRLLDRVVPVDLDPRAGEVPRDVVLRVGRALSGEVLAVQGPPGSGKTRVGADLIRELIGAGLTVGVTAQSHAVVSHLLSEVGLNAIQKCEEEDFRGGGTVQRVSTNDSVDVALATRAVRLVGGSAWLWARDQAVDSVDVLVVDEAGQFSLANAVAVSRAARSMVLLGDPQQLTSPTQAVHPHGAGVSVLQHMIGEHDTIPSGRGVFLDTTWRMHPVVARFVSGAFYEGRLSAEPGRERQAVTGAGQLSGAGLRWVPVDHVGNSSASDQEVEVVHALVRDLLQSGGFVDAEGLERPLGPEDVLVVTPYNRQVGRLRNALPDGVLAGTVDKFQGRQAAVVVYSMASSSAVDAPRGVDFLYDLHRLNVAVSRAKAMTVVVASPALLDAAVHSPEQLRQVNALCSYAEDAVWVVPQAAGVHSV